MHSTSTPNRLSTETSPYLLQHAHNPVDWFPWGEEALQKAKSEDKPIILSIGYSACHWCHVMERESFENDQIAEIMNRHYVCIKVDREERPDIDQIYMDAVHAMGLQGGWPLNVILTPEGKPFYGGTYFPAGRWANLLNGVQEAFVKDRDKLEESANGFAETLNQSEYEKYGLKGDAFYLAEAHYTQMLAHLAKSFDTEKGGNDRAPKFPMPCVWQLLLRYHAFFQDKTAYDQAHITLKKMTLGGIYDQAGGGFARYSTDVDWFAPHFEKMLYDNGQLLSLYSEAYQSKNDPLYKETVYGTVAFVDRELTSPEFGFYSALDADSEGVEGKFYTFTYEQIEQIALPEKQWFLRYYNIRPEGTWEHGVNILHRENSSEEFCTEHGLTHSSFLAWENEWKRILLSERSKRIRPGLDDKILASWNGLMLNGLVDAYRTFDKPAFLELALKNAHFLTEKMMKDGKIWHSYKNGQAKIEGYLEDYACLIQAFTNLYQATFDEHWLEQAKLLTDTCLHLFWDENEGLFFFTSSESEKLIARKKELFDNVIPASNSIMAGNLLTLGHLVSNHTFLEMGKAMVESVQHLLSREPYYLAHWASVSLHLYKPMFEVAISGPEAMDFRKAIDKKHVPNKVMAGSLTENTLSLLQNRGTIEGKTAIYVCQNQTCQLPVTSVEEALEMMAGDVS
jgi:uncharacterized protein